MLNEMTVVRCRDDKSERGDGNYRAKVGFIAEIGRYFRNFV